MKTILAICAAALVLGGCRAATTALTVGAAYLDGRNGTPPAPRPQVVQVEVEPFHCTTFTHGNLSQTNCR
jgi:hypothetical protein